MIGTHARVATSHHGAGALSPSMTEYVVAVLACLAGADVFYTVFAMAGISSGAVTGIWLLIYGFVIVTLFWRHDIGWLLWLCSRQVLLTIVLIAAFASVLWSINPGLTAQRAIHLCGSSLVGVWFGYTFGPMHFFRVLSWTFGILIPGSVLISMALPEHGLQLYEGAYVWKGLHAEKNGMGLSAAIAVAFFALGFMTGKLPRAYCFCLSLLALLMLVNTNSATSILALAAAMSVGIAFYSSTRLRLHPPSAIASLIFIGGLAAVITSFLPVDELTGTLGRSSNLTGRTELWTAAWNVTMQQPFVGFGYGTIWFPREGFEHVQENLLRITWVAHHAHNSFLHISSELGIPIAIIAVALLPVAIVQAVYLYSRHASLFGLFGLVFITFFIVSGFSEVRIFVDRSFHWMLFIATTVSLLRAAELRRKQHHATPPLDRR